MKTIYQILNKEDQQKVRKNFKDNNGAQATRLLRLILIGSGAIIYSIINLIIEFLSDNPNIFFMVLCGLCFSAGVFFIFESFVIRSKEYNKITKKLKLNK